MTASDTIVALATPHGTGAVCVLRLSGPDAFRIAGRLWRGRMALESLPPRMLARGRLVDGQGHVLDNVLAARFPGPASFTGEDVVEIHGHGGRLLAQLLLEELARAGARPAGPGEFSQRAFLNGKLDLAQAEAVMDLISAQTILGVRAANRQLEGALSAAVAGLRAQVLEILAHVEAYIDFPEEDIDPDTGAALAGSIGKSLAGVRGLLQTAERGRILRQGLRLVIAGEPNAGKSSLLNLLLGFDRAIVSPEAGTTRDTVEETIDLGGLPVRLIDTAGLRPDGDAVERLGMERSKAALRSADFVLEVVDGTLAPESVRRVVLPEETPHHLLVVNKVDQGLHPDWKAHAAVRISCATRAGIEDLVHAVQSALATGDFMPDGSLLAINARHQQCLGVAETGLLAALSLLEAGMPPELIAEELRQAMHAIGDICGRMDAEEVLGVIFGRFCIGK